MRVGASFFLTHSFVSYGNSTGSALFLLLLILGPRLHLRMLAPTVVQANEMEEKLEAKKGDMHPKNEPRNRKDTYYLVL